MKKRRESKVKKSMSLALSMIMFFGMAAQVPLGIAEASYDSAKVYTNPFREVKQEENAPASKEEKEIVSESQQSGAQPSGTAEPDEVPSSEDVEEDEEKTSEEAEEDGEQTPEESGQDKVQPSGTAEPDEVPSSEDVEEGGEKTSEEAEEDGEQTPEESGQDKVQPPGTAEPDNVHASSTDSEDETKEAETKDEEFCPIVEILERDGGTDRDGIVFSSGTVIYTIKVTEQTIDIGMTKEDDFSSNVLETEENSDGDKDEAAAVIKYKIADFEGSAPIEECMSQIIFEEELDGLLQVWYEYGEVKSPVIEEYLLIERQAPEVVCERQGEGLQQYAHITVTESGTIQSGIRECQIMMDGETIDSDGMHITAEDILPNGQKVPVCQEIDIPLTGDSIHDIQILVSDYAGNETEKTVTMRAVPEDVSNVILPSSFQVIIKPYSEERWQIYSDDIVIQNQNDFPVDVIISGVELYVNHYVQDEEALSDNMDGTEGSQGVLDPDKNCEVNFQLRQGGEEVLFFQLKEGENEEIPQFSLAAREEQTEMQVYPADRTDCAVINLCGVLEPGSEPLWRDGDLTVKLSFRFIRHAAEEEVQQKNPEDVQDELQHGEEKSQPQNPLDGEDGISAPEVNQTAEPQTESEEAGKENGVQEENAVGRQDESPLNNFFWFES